MDKALGLIEIRGLATAIMVADVMAKTASVNIIDAEKAQGSGWITVKIAGDVAAVTASINAGKQVGEMNGHFVSSKIIPRPAAGLLEFFCTPDEPEEGACDCACTEAEEEQAKAVTVETTIVETVPIETVSVETEAEPAKEAEPVPAEEKATEPAPVNNPAPKKPKKNTKDNAALPSAEKELLIENKEQ